MAGERARRRFLASEFGGQRLPRLTYPRGRGTNGARRSVGALFPSSGLTCTCRRRTHLCTHRRPSPPPVTAGSEAARPRLPGGARREGPPRPRPPVSSSPAPAESGPSPPRRPSATPLTWRGWRRPQVGKTRRGCRELGRLSKSWGRVWLAGAPPALSLGGALGGPLPALRVPCYRASGEDAPPRRSPPGLHPARTTTLPRAAPLLFARPRPAPGWSWISGASWVSPSPPAPCRERRAPRC